MCIYRYIRTPETLNPIPCVAAAAASARPRSRRGGEVGLGSRVGGLLRRRAYLIVYFLVLKVFKFFFAIGLWVSALCSECQRIEIRASAGIRGSSCDSVF